jgi:hypothetical protein
LGSPAGKAGIFQSHQPTVWGDAVMSITAYEYLSILQARDVVSEQTKESGGFDYQKLLENVRTIIAEKHSAELPPLLAIPKPPKPENADPEILCSRVGGKEFDRES